MENNVKTANRVSVVTIIVNAILSAFKLLAGILANSAAMVSDSVHSMSDVFSTFIVIIGVNVSGKKSDKSHQYGHERFECVASIILAVILAITGLGIGQRAIMSIINGEYEGMEPGILALIAALVSIGTKEWMYWYTRAAAKKTNSGALMADAWHHRSDAMSSVGAFIGILGARLGFPVLDAVAGIVICVFILKAALDIFKDAINKMVDKACDPKTIAKLEAVIMEQSGVMGIDLLRTRIFGSKIYVDIEIAADGNLTLHEAHIIAENVHDAVEEGIDEVKHCMVHVNPMNNEEKNE
ncbi:MAG: cation diffusion facilitator family transporter [Oscillospiraceae bacterium]|nr:cation diffusion facilitator family transporter [Oscillospiraceae bacterium]